MSYEVIKPNQLFQGKTYNDWAKDYFSWYFSEDPDDHNDGPVVFLKSTPTISTITDDNLNSALRQMTNPNVMIGDDRLYIRKDQAILIPAIVAYFSQTGPSDNYHTLKNFVRDAAANSDTPRSNQIKINAANLSVDPKDYSLETDVFTLNVPDAPPGSSYKDYVEYQPLPPGPWPTVGGGYFFLVKLLDRRVYTIVSRVKGKKYQDGRDYYADLLYEISVT